MESKTSRASFITGLVATIVAGGMLGVSVGAPAMVERAATRAIASVEQRFGVRLDADAVDWGWGGSATASNVVVRDRSGEVLATIALVTIDARADLMARQLELASVHFEGVAVALRLNADGSTNVDGILAGLRGGDEGAGGGGIPGSRFLVDRAPRIQVDDLRVVVDANLGGLPFGFKLPPRLGFAGGSVRALPVAVGDRAPGIREAIWDIAVSFDDMTLDPGFGATLTVRAGVEAGLEQVGLDFKRPVRLPVGQRLAAIGGVGWTRDAAAVELRQLQLSQPMNEPGADRVSAAVSIPRIAIAPVNVEALLMTSSAVSTSGVMLSTLGELRKHGRFEIEEPVVAFTVGEDGHHNFEDLLAMVRADPTNPADGSTPAPSPTPGTASHRRGAQTAAAAPPADAIKGIVTAGFQSLDARANKFLARLAAASDPSLGAWPTVSVRGGRVYLTLGERALRVEGASLQVLATETSRKVAAEADVVSGGAAEPGHVRLAFERGADGAPDALRASFEATRIPLGALAGSRNADGKVSFARGAQLAEVRGALAGSAAPGGAWTIDGALSFDGLIVNMPVLATEPMAGIDGAVAGRISWNPNDNLLRLDELSLSRGGVTVKGEVDVLDPGRSPRVKVALSLPSVDVQSVFNAIPSEVVPALKGLQMRGRLSWELGIDLDTEKVDSIAIDSRPKLVDFDVASLGNVIDFNKMYSAVPYQILLFDGTPGTRFVGPGTGSWVPLQRIAPWLPLALTTTEDGTFERHDGISTLAIKESIVTNLKRGAFVRGGSTITQQLVKNLYLGGSKHIGRKLQELFIAWRLTQFMPKDRVMEFYLNTIEFGPGIYGIGDAAYHWFGKRPADLDLTECIFLASVIPSPRRYHSFFQAGAITPRWRSYLEMLLGVMVKRGKITAEDMAAAAPYEPRFRGVKVIGAGAVFDAPPDRDRPDDDDPLDDLPVRVERDEDTWDGDIQNAP